MPRLFQRTARDPTAPTPGLEQAKLILSFVASLGDGAVAVPGLKAVAKMVIQVIEIAQIVQSNKADSLIIAERAGQLMEAMIETLRDKSEATVDPLLLRDLDRFRRDLEGILQVLEALTKPNLAEKVFKHKGHSEELLQCKETLDHSFKRFQVYSTIALRLDMYNLKQGQGQNAQDVLKSIDVTTFANPRNGGPGEDRVHLQGLSRAVNNTSSATLLAGGSNNQAECGYCAYEMATQRLLPCGHLFCDDCSTVSACPTCRGRIMTREKIHGCDAVVWEGG